MSAPSWSDLLNLNNIVDTLFVRVQRAVEPTAPISREIPFFATLEARFDDLPTRFTTDATTVPPASMIRTGQNVRRVTWENGGSRVFVRSIGFQPFKMNPTTLARVTANDRFPFNWRWNFETSITNRRYADQRVLAASAGRWVSGSPLDFKDPLVIEPREGFTFDCELLSFGMRSSGETAATSAVVQMVLSGYREGV